MADTLMLISDTGDFCDFFRIEMGVNLSTLPLLLPESTSYTCDILEFSSYIF